MNASQQRTTSNEQRAYNEWKKNDRSSRKSGECILHCQNDDELKRSFGKLQFKNYLFGDILGEQHSLNE